MYFEVAAGLIVFGLTVWVIGALFRYPGVSIIGGAILIIAGSAIALTDIEVRTGEFRNYQYQAENNGNDYVLNASQSTYTYETTTLGAMLNIGMLAPLGLGGLVMLLGAVLTAHSLDEFR